MTGLKVIDGTPTEMSKYLRDKELEDEIENADMNGIVNLFNDLRYSKSTLSKCNPEELLSFVKLCCKIERELENKKGQLKGRQEARKEFIEEFEKMIDIDKIYPTDLFPEVSKDELRLINEYCQEVLKFPLDRLSAHLSREILKGINKQLKQLGEK